MKVKNIATILFLLITTMLFSQHKINNYKYVIVLNKFDFLKQPDQYKTSSLTKFLFNKNGYKAYLSNEQLPVDLTENKCLALEAEVKSKSSFFGSKSYIELKDCYKNVIFKSEIGTSKLKDYRKTYNESIRKAFNSIKALNYTYSPTKKEIPVKITSRIKKVNQVKSNKNISANIKVTKATDILYAQPKDYGFQLVNTKPEVVFKALKTNKKDVYILSDKNGILYKNDNNWVAEYYENGKKVIEHFQIKL